jgi:catechol 2,3-dioxygenase-like lactoylglutathione lyase family enzyme
MPTAMTSTSVTAASTPIDVRKFHISLNVSDLAQSIAFYRALFGIEPAKSYPDYAKFEVEEPPIILSLAPGPRPGSGGNLNHVGLRVRTSEELVDIQRRIEMAGIQTRREEGVACCYALQTKFWAHDPDNAMWEIYVLHQDIEEHGYARKTIPVQAVAAAGAPRVVWEHRVPAPVPSRIEHDDNSVDAVSLQGTINADPARGALTTFLSEIVRVLKPGGFVHCHGVAAARPLDGPMPPLPGLAGHVRDAVTRDELIHALQAAGLTDVRVEHFGECGCLVANGVPLHEIELVAVKAKRTGVCC